MLVVADDIYERLIYDGLSFYNIAQVVPALKSRTIVVNGVSKTYAMTGWRIGYAAGPREIIAAITGLGVYARFKFESGVHRDTRFRTVRTSGLTLTEPGAALDWKTLD